MNDVKIYSLNLMAFIVYETDLQPKLHYEYCPDRGQKYYGTYPLSESVQQAIDDYNGDEDIYIELHKYKDIIKDITIRKNKIKNGLKQWNS